MSTIQALAYEMKITIISFLLFCLLAECAQACLPFIPNEEVQKGYQAAEALLQREDTNGLIALITNSNYIVEQRAALYLGQLGATNALPALRKKDRGYPRFSTVSIGAFSVAIAMIESGSDDTLSRALLTLAMTGFSSVGDLEIWRQGSIDRVQRTRRSKDKTEASLARIEKMAKEARLCIVENRIFDGADRNRSDAAAEALLEFANEAVIRKLKPIRAYGAQYTVLAYQCRKISTAESIALCIDILGKHETPQKAQAAGRLLKAFGVHALPAVRQLLEEHEAMVTAPPPPSVIHHTIVSRCKNILRTIEANKAIDDD
jgi:hypothetical protein